MNWSTVFGRRAGNVIPGLDGLRAFSVLCVIYGHLLWAPSFSGALNRFVNPAALGVRMFFVISGFLITSILLEEKSRTGTVSLRQFYYRRALRIFPAYYVFLACTFMLAWYGVIGLEPSDYFYTLTYTFNLKGEQATWWVGHTWSLAVEEQFYLLWPLIVLACGQTVLERVSLFFVVIAPVGRMVLGMWPEAYSHWFLALPFVADPIALGAWLALAFRKPAFQDRAKALLAGTWFWAVLIFAVALDSLGRRPVFFLYPSIVAGVVEPIVNICLTLVVARVALVRTGRVAEILNSKPAVAIGVASYSLYLWQMLFISPVAARWVTFPLNVVWTCLAATLSFLLVEKPFNELRHRVRSAPALLRSTPNAVEV